jgi:hypothetical protein
MDFGIDTIVYLIIGIIFVLVQATRKRNVAKGTPQAAEAQVEKEEVKEELSAFWKEFLGTDLTANQDPEPVRINPVPHDVIEPDDFHRPEHSGNMIVPPKSSLNDPGNLVVAGHGEPANLSDEEPMNDAFDLRSAVIYSTILERKYV